MDFELNETERLLNDSLLRFAQRRQVNFAEHEFGFPKAGLHRDEGIIVQFGSALGAVDLAIAVAIGAIVRA